MPVTNYPLISGVGNGGGAAGTSVHPNFASFPVTGTSGIIYVDTGLNDLYLWTGTVYELQSSTGGGTWGSITGTLSSQTDLQTVLNSKEDELDWNVNPSRQFLYFTDFNEADRAGLNLANDSAGGAGHILTNDSTYGTNTTENAFGAFAFVSGTGATARACMYSSGILIVGNNRIKLGLRTVIDQLSTAGTAYTLQFGLGDQFGSADQSNGVYFRYTHSVNSGLWEGVTAAASTRTTVNLTVGPTASQYQELEIDINQNATQADFYIDGTLRGTLSTGFPSTSDFLRFYWKIVKSTGTGSPNMTTDWFYIKTTRTTAR